MTEQQQEIIRRFRENVKGRRPETSEANERHDGKVGHWLERQMGLSANRSNDPDLFGYEMKNATKSKTTFGDWSANDYIFKDPASKISRSDFLHIFGKPNLEKGGRPSWSGEPVPKVSGFNRFGQMLEIDDAGNVLAIYCYDQDQRSEKATIVPTHLQQQRLVLARWNADKLRHKLENKFNQQGWFKCERNADGVYHKIVFGKPMSYEAWLDLLRAGLVFFDSGMYLGNSRNYSQFRANNNLWDSLIVSEFD